MDFELIARARDYALSGGGSGCITLGGRLVLAWGDQKKLYDLKSSTKSIGVTSLGLAILDGKMTLSDLASQRYPDFAVPPAENAKSGWAGKITLFHLATQTAGFEKSGGFQKLIFEPGTTWCYSDGGPNWLAECVTLAYRCDVADLMFERVFAPLGIKPSDLSWRKNAYRPEDIEGIPRREFGSGISANVDAMARIGLLYLRGGRWRNAQIIPQDFVDACRSTPAAIRGLPVAGDSRHPRASDHYGLLWWNNADGALVNVPRDAYWSWGLYESLIIIVPSLDIVVSRAGQSWKGLPGGQYAKLAPFLDPIIASVNGKIGHKTRTGPDPPCPPSRIIAALEWAPANTIVRKACDSDNWPMTWADDDTQYTAYGDGTGFAPKVKNKLSLGMARIEGPACAFVGYNIRSASAEQKGDGPAGKKASGMLSVEGVLYMLARNAKNSQIAWSKDRGETWTWAEWRFTSGFGCPTFLNFGRDYAGARDGYVYIYSPDSDSAYKPADRMVLARAPKDGITDPAAYEFFVRVGDDGAPVWDKDVGRRGAVFEHKGRCYRSSVTYSPAIKRYLWVQIIPGGDTRFKGGFGVYDAPEPWGPWTTVFFTEQWDVGPGESASFPAKWMSEDGKRLYLVFSGNDCFSVREASVRLADHAETGGFIHK